MPAIDIDKMYMNIALEVSKASYAVNAKVGALIVKDNSIVAYGYNGTPYGFDNCCEDDNGKTKYDVIHAEINAICKASKAGISTDKATLYVTLSPCVECAKAIIQSGINTVYYSDIYRNAEGFELLKNANIFLKKI